MLEVGDLFDLPLLLCRCRERLALPRDSSRAEAVGDFRVLPMRLVSSGLSMSNTNKDYVTVGDWLNHDHGVSRFPRRIPRQHSTCLLLPTNSHMVVTLYIDCTMRLPLFSQSSRVILVIPHLCNIDGRSQLHGDLQSVARARVIPLWNNIADKSSRIARWVPNDSDRASSMILRVGLCFREILWT